MISSRGARIPLWMIQWRAILRYCLIPLHVSSLNSTGLMGLFRSNTSQKSTKQRNKTKPCTLYSFINPSTITSPTLKPIAWSLVINNPLIMPATMKRTGSTSDVKKEIVAVQRKNKTKPNYATMIRRAILALNPSNRSTVSFPAISKYISQRYPGKL